MSAVLTAPAVRGRRNGRPEPLENGERLTAAEFMRRYEAMPEIKEAELIEGLVYMGSPVRMDLHAVPDALIQTWLGTYASETRGTEVGANGTVQLDVDNVPQPDALLRITEACGGSSKLDGKGYLAGAPELVVEIAASSSSIDLHDKLRAYRRNGVKEYLDWRTTERAFNWFVLAEGAYHDRQPNGKGLYHSTVFPGLVLNVPALLAGDSADVLATLKAALKSKAHQTFVAHLASRSRKPSSKG